jgi:hypothetical protein
MEVAGCGSKRNGSTKASRFFLSEFSAVGEMVKVEAEALFFAFADLQGEFWFGERDFKLVLRFG